MLMPNMSKFAVAFGGQYAATIITGGRKTLSGKCNGQTLRGLPNMIVDHSSGAKCTLFGVICQLNNWNEIQYSTPSLVEGETNEYGVIPFNWKGEDVRCDQIRKWVRDMVVEHVDCELHFHFVVSEKQVKGKSNGLSANILADLGL